MEAYQIHSQRSEHGTDSGEERGHTETHGSHAGGVELRCVEVDHVEEGGHCKFSTRRDDQD